MRYKTIVDIVDIHLKNNDMDMATEFLDQELKKVTNQLNRLNELKEEISKQHQRSV